MTAMSIETIVVGVDREGRSDHALRAALQLSECLKVRLRLIHAVHISPQLKSVLEPADSAATYATVLSAAWKEQSARLPEVFAACGRENEDVEVLLTVLPGGPAEVISNYANEVGADLIMLGPHERQGVFDFGSTARSILSSGAAGVWVQKREPRPIKHILVPIDLSQDSLFALERVCILARQLEAKVTVLHCFQPTFLSYPSATGYPLGGAAYVVDHVRDAVRDQFEAAVAEPDWAGIEHDSLFVEGLPVDQILEQQSGVDLIALGSHGHSGFSAVLMGNVAYSVLKQASTPVLALRHPDRLSLVAREAEQKPQLI